MGCTVWNSIMQYDKKRNLSDNTSIIDSTRIISFAELLKLYTKRGDRQNHNYN